MSVDVSHLTKIYGTQRAVDDVSFTAHPGQILGFLGPNGAGKSTTMKIITGYLNPSEGQVRVCGLDVTKDTLAAQRQIGYLPEHNPLYKDMYVREYLTFVGRLYGVANLRQRVAQLVELTGLEQEQSKLIGALSKGYRQRVGLAQAMIHDPEVLILDEPTSGLDPNQLAEIRRLIKTLGEEKTVIFSTHIMQEVQALCDQVIIINRGRLVANDPIDRLQARLQGETVVTVAFAQHIREELLQALPGLRSIERQGTYRWRLTTGSEADIREALFRIAVQEDAPLLELHRDELSIEEVFRQLTEKPVAI
ncbi:MAG: gliding motility-associated ABC transporter ATP-binding subunit GldA [Bacteroidetes bacterium]|nr:MAG: gliding motility-associated ABC transporter ATP-binding subunit GldA [Bacteroidota bacterium]